MNADLVSLGTLLIGSHAGDLSPDGNRAYGLETLTTPYSLRIFDVTGGTFTELAPISLTGVNTGIGRVATDPGGDFVFVVTEGKFVVVDVR